MKESVTITKIIISLVFSFSFFLQANSYRVDIIDALVWSEEEDDFVYTEVDVFFNSANTKLFHLNFYGYNNNVRVYGFNFLDIPAIHANIEKYIRWNRRAINDAELLDRELGEVDSVYGMFFGNNQTYTQPGARIKFHIFSQSEEEHQMVWELTPLWEQDNPNYLVGKEYIYFDLEDAENFKEVFTTEYWFNKVGEILELTGE